MESCVIRYRPEVFMKTSAIEISIIIPVHNEEENLPILAQKLHDVLAAFGRTYECVLVDDGSLDKSTGIMRELSDKYPCFRSIFLRRNFGQTAALMAGFDHSSGSVVITMDADLQNDPEDIPMLVSYIDQGYDLVSGWRKGRQDSFIRNFPSKIANAIIRKVTGVQIHDSGCTLKAYKREILTDLRLYGEMHRFIPALASWMGIRLIEVPVKHHPRKFGESKYGISRTFRVILDLLTVKFLLSYSSSPIQMFGKFGYFVSFGGFILFFAAIILKFTAGKTLTGNPLFYFFILMQLTAVQLVLIGLLAELSMRIYHESQQKKTYVIRE